MKDRTAPWILAPVADFVRQPVAIDWIGERLGAPTVDVRSELEQGGFRFDRGWNDESTAQLARSAARLIAQAPSLEATAFSAIQNIHLLTADPGYDISHSEPRWRTSIFVSRPDRIDHVGELRFAECIIHEAMHLHLTNNEESTPLVQAFDRLMTSPWRTSHAHCKGCCTGYSSSPASLSSSARYQNP